ncbi:MAG: amidohydrolase, partial [Lachnospiraceae bacterium]|nr:amidohydrolase [Lachnospiraceae bacterium]
MQEMRGFYMILKNATIHDAIHPEAYTGDIVMREGKLAQVGGTAEALPGEEVIDASGLLAYPGFVDAHSHIGLDDYGGPTGTTQDFNEMNDICCPQLRGIDSYYPQDAAIPMARSGGVTTVATGPGSANVLGGTFLAAKLRGNSVEAALVKEAVAMKCAFGENPKRCYRDKKDSARMTTAAILREALFNARDYMLRKEAAGGDITRQPKFDMKMEALIPVLKGELPLKAHAHRADDIMTALRIALEFGLRITIE